MDNLKDIIQDQRKALKMTQKDLAARLNVSDKVISKWETGVSYPDLTIINALAKELEVPVTKLLSLPELTKPIASEKVDENLILKHRTSLIISFSILVLAILLSLLIFIGEYNGIIDPSGFGYILLLFLAIGSGISSVVYLFISNLKYKTAYTQKFVRKPYDIIFLKNNLLMTDLLRLTLYLMTFTLIEAPEISVPLRLLLLACFLVSKIRLINETMHTIKNRIQLSILILFEIVSLPLLFIDFFEKYLTIYLIFLSITAYVLLTSFSYFKMKYKNQ